eukprot:5845021-Prymnesium_polylepis.1
MSCTLYKAAGELNPSLIEGTPGGPTGSSCIISFPKPITSTDGGRLMFETSHDNPAVPLWRKASSPEEWTVAELAGHQGDSKLIEVVGLGQRTKYEFCCIYALRDNGSRIFVLTPALAFTTFYGDRDDFYHKEEPLGRGGYAAVYPGWHRAAEGQPMFEPKAMKVFCGPNESDAFQYWDREKMNLGKASAAAYGSRCMIKWTNKVRSRCPGLCSPCGVLELAACPDACRVRVACRSMGVQLVGRRRAKLSYCRSSSAQREVGPLNGELDLQDSYRSQIKGLIDLVQKLHANKIMHKDLAMSNILVCEDGRCVEGALLLDHSCSIGYSHQVY